MDPNIVKLLEEDEDETMHSEADLESFTAELNREIKGSASTTQQQSDYNSGGLSLENSHTASKFLQHWQASDNEENSSFQSGMTMEPKHQHPTSLESQQDWPNCHKQEDNSTSEPMGVMTSGKNPIHTQQPKNEPHPERGSLLYNSQGFTGQQSTAMGSNNQLPLTREMNDLQPLSSGTGNQQTSGMGISNRQVMATMNQHGTGARLNNQQSMTLGASNQMSVTSSSQQPGTMLKLDQQVQVGKLLHIMMPQVDKDRAMQLQTLYNKLRKHVITKDNFTRHMRGLVGEQMLTMALYKLNQASKNSQTPQNQSRSPLPATGQQLQVSPSDLRKPTSDNSIVKSHVVESQADSQGLRGSDKQQHSHFSQKSFPTYGSSGNSYFPSSGTSSLTSIQLRLHDSQMRQAPAHQNIIPSDHLGPTTQNINVTNLSKFERPPSFNDPKKMQARKLTQKTSNSELQQNLAGWASSTGVSSSKLYTKQEPVDQSSELQFKSQLNSSRGLSTVPSLQSMMSSLTAPVGPGNYKASLRKPLAGQKKQLEAPDSSAASSKKQKVSEASLDQSIKQVNDVTAVSWVSLREEEEQLLSDFKEDSWVSEAYRRVVQEEEERLVFNKIPLQKQVVEIMGKYGLKNMNSDVERCLSWCVEERMCGIIADLIRLSKQRVDMEKTRHRIIYTSDIRHRITGINGKAREEWEKKQAEIEKSQKLNETESDSRVDSQKEKSESHKRLAKDNKDKEDKGHTTAANIAVRAATGVGDMLSKWRLMIEAKQKLEGTDIGSGSQPGRDGAWKLLSASVRNTKENQVAEKWDRSPASNTPASSRKFGRNQIVMPQVARSISVKDVIAILEMGPQMSKSALIYRLYNRVSANDAVE